MNLQRQCQSNKKENIPGNGFTLFSGKDMVRNKHIQRTDIVQPVPIIITAMKLTT
ncbi:hypothetical protein Phum_PHUM136250 [Pediculus humanus corporis]|uniref:Uncharacterized protein n=1 Tax=Pediculus humanus subsp. corporis TaxID=121224 RepID=E0VEL9_PEDHC|nr:uncharacterized protein Phum_PHUM136250 [Pediculus humanus corporis]EEB11825.1 hypothetical protein Phum_PHUM136250 [Pediculus humanus corporis]